MFYYFLQTIELLQFIGYESKLVTGVAQCNSVEFVTRIGFLQLLQRMLKV